MCSAVCGAVSRGAVWCVRQAKADGRVQNEGGRWWSVDSVAGGASGRHMVDYVLASTSG